MIENLKRQHQERNEDLFLMKKGEQTTITNKPSSLYIEGWKVSVSIRGFKTRTVIRDEIRGANIEVIKTKLPKTLLYGGLSSGMKLPSHQEAMNHGGIARVRAEILSKRKKDKPKKRKASAVRLLY